MIPAEGGERERKRTLTSLAACDGFWPGVGLGALRLIRFVMPESALVEPRDEPDESMLLGRAGFLAGCGMNDAVGCRTLSAVGRTNMPCPMGHSK